MTNGASIFSDFKVIFFYLTEYIKKSVSIQTFKIRQRFFIRHRDDLIYYFSSEECQLYHVSTILYQELSYCLFFKKSEITYQNIQVPFISNLVTSDSKIFLQVRFLKWIENDVSYDMEEKEKYVFAYSI